MRLAKRISKVGIFFLLLNISYYQVNNGQPRSGNGSFSFHTFANLIIEMSIENVLDKTPANAQIIKEPVENIHVPGLIDTIYHIYSRQDEFHFYKTTGKEILYKAHFQSSTYWLVDEIYIGALKDDVKESLSGIQEIAHDTLIFRDADDWIIYSFIFSELNKLKEIRLEAFLD